MPGYLYIGCAVIYMCVVPTIDLVIIPQFSLPESDSLLLLGAGLAAVASLMRRKKGGK